MRRLLLLVAILSGLGGAAAGQTICLDPGHPSETSAGTRGRHSTEIHVVWELANRVKSLLEAKGAQVVMTKASEHQLVTNRQRAEIANEAHAALMLRLHCDAGSGSGFAVYYPNRQGLVHGVRGPSQTVLQATAPVARRFHQVLATDLNGVLSDNGLLDDTRTAIGSKQRALTGSIFSKVPVVLVEIVVLTNPKDEQFINSARGMDLAARALADAALRSVRG